MVWKGLRALVAILLAYVCFVAAMRWVGPNAAQREALAQLQAPTPPVSGRDGSDWIWLMDRDVPEAQGARVAAATRRWIDSKDPFGKRNPTGRDPRLAFAAYPKSSDVAEAICQRDQLGCLGFVRRNLPSVDAAMAPNERSIARGIEFASGHDGMRLGIQIRLVQDLPPLGHQRELVRTWFARRFVNGQQVEAVTGLCRDLAGWRRLGGDSDFLIGSLLGAAFVRQDVRLLSEMLAEWPSDRSPPDECTAALAPAANYELDLCPSMRTEFDMIEFMDAHFQDVAEQSQEGYNPYTDLLVDRRNARAMLAQHRAALCGEDVLRGSRADLPAKDFLPEPSSCSYLRMAADPLGCVLAEIDAGNGIGKYQDRRTDQAATIALLRTVLWIRAQGATPATAQRLLDDRPSSLGFQRKASFDAATNRVSMPMLETSRGEIFTLQVFAPPTESVVAH